MPCMQSKKRTGNIDCPFRLSEGQLLQLLELLKLHELRQTKGTNTYPASE